MVNSRISQTVTHRNAISVSFLRRRKLCLRESLPQLVMLFNSYKQKAEAFENSHVREKLVECVGFTDILVIA